MVKLQAGHMHHNIGVENTLTPKNTFLQTYTWSWVGGVKILYISEMVAIFGFGVPELYYYGSVWVQSACTYIFVQILCAKFANADQGI